SIDPSAIAPAHIMPNLQCGPQSRAGVPSRWLREDALIATRTLQRRNHQRVPRHAARQANVLRIPGQPHHIAFQTALHARRQVRPLLTTQLRLAIQPQVLKKLWAETTLPLTPQ